VVRAAIALRVLPLRFGWKYLDRGAFGEIARYSGVSFILMIACKLKTNRVHKQGRTSTARSHQDAARPRRGSTNMAVGEYLSKLYRRLPVIREMKATDRLLEEMQSELRRISAKGTG
jgi:hypothetical protein